MNTKHYNVLRRLRKRHDYNQVELAKRLGTTQSWLSLLESGKRAVLPRDYKMYCEDWLDLSEGERAELRVWFDQFKKSDKKTAPKEEVLEVA